MRLVSRLGNDWYKIKELPRQASYLAGIHYDQRNYESEFMDCWFATPHKRELRNCLIQKHLS